MPHMRLLRFICALALAVSLAASPVFAAVAMAQSAPQEMAMGAAGDDCPCCDHGGNGAEVSPMTCCHVSANSVESLVVPRPRAVQLFESVHGVLVAFIARPEPPPPRS